MGAWSTGSKPSSKNAALVAALLTKEACIALGALVDDGRVWETAGKAELEFVGWSLTETKATLAAGVRAVGLAASSVTYPIVWPLWKHSFAVQKASAGRLLYSEKALDATMAIQDLVSRALEA